METIYQLTGGAIFFHLIFLSFIFRIFRSAHDALSGPAEWIQEIQKQNGQGYTYSTINRMLKVGQWPWHILNWMGRDFFIGGLYLYAYMRGCNGWVITGAVIINWLLHDLVYWFVSAMREHFQWGQGWPSFPSIFKRVFQRR